MLLEAEAPLLQTQCAPSVPHDTHQHFALFSLFGKGISNLMKIKLVSWHWVGNENSSSNFDKAYIYYFAITNTSFSLIFLFFQLLLMCPDDVLQ